MTDYEKSVSESLASLAKSFETIAKVIVSYTDSTLKMAEEAKQRSLLEDEEKAKRIIEEAATIDTTAEKQNIELTVKEQELRAREIAAREKEIQLREAALSNQEAQ